MSQAFKNLFSLKRFILLMGYLFLYAPIILIIVFSFNSTRYPGQWTGFSWKWFEALLEDESLIKAAWVSFKIAATSASLATILGTMASIGMRRYKKFKGRTFFLGLSSSPLVMPEIVTGIALLLFFVSLERLTGWPSERGFMTITIVHTTLTFAYVFLIVRSRLSDFDQSLEEAAQDLGARGWRVLVFVTLPIILPSILSGWILAFILSFDDVVLASLLSGPGSTTLPVVIFSSIRLGVNPQINALATILILVSFVLVLISFILVRKNLSVKKGS